jgi:Zn-dependent peptidase ImmA (M78 family)
LIEVKEYYGISIQALGYRLQQLGIVEKSWAIRFWKYIKSDKDRRQEIGLGEYTGKESSERFQQLVYKALAEEIISIGKAAELLNTDINNVRNELHFV